MTYDLRTGWDGASIRLRPLKPEDRQAIQACIEGPDPAQRRTELWALFRNVPKGDCGTWGIETHAGQVVGAIATTSCQRRQGTFEFELAILPSFERQGYGREAAYLVLHAYFNDLHYQKVTVSTISYNVSASRFLRAIGFHGEGQLRRLVLIEGHRYDLVLYGMTDEEFARWESYADLRRAQRAGGRR